MATLTVTLWLPRRNFWAFTHRSMITLPLGWTRRITLHSYKPQNGAPFVFMNGYIFSVEFPSFLENPGIICLPIHDGDPNPDLQQDFSGPRKGKHLYLISLVWLSDRWDMAQPCSSITDSQVLTVLCQFRWKWEKNKLLLILTLTDSFLTLIGREV